jgi:putative hemolysin
MDFLSSPIHALLEEPHAKHERHRAWLLRSLSSRAPVPPVPQDPPVPPAPEPLCEPIPAAELADEVAQLDPSSRLASVGALEAWIAPAAAIPRTLLEIGRLRELSFRAVGEGTGRACDLDRFDASYLQLFLWDRALRAVAGGYRLGPVDELLARGGTSALYTSTLFEYEPEVLRLLGTALELGRSFVTPTHQRSHAALLTLWKGIGAFVARNPRYRMLFGPVSISADYHPFSRQLLGHWLEARHRHAELFGRVRGRTPFRFQAVDGLAPERLRGLAAATDDVEELVTGIERGERGVPVLLSEYLKLGGKLLALNVDASFQDALDALVVVDLVRAPQRLLERYLGKDGAAAFLDAHAREARVA